ncbi:MAG: glycosyltransferase family 39 protein [Bdellovibrionales bacterium]|nr:glycosyltransferase family 39 protein [Bdellovibrionales bacterium]
MQKKLIQFWWLTLFVKIILATFMPLFNDEAYYWVWSHHLQLSYFDHPPFIAWLNFLGQPFENVLGLVRLPSIIMGHMTLWIWILIGKFYLSKEKLLLFFFLSLFMPFVGPASLIATPDLPLLFFWSLSLLFLINIVDGENSLINFSLLGLFLGLGFSSKYHMALTAPLFFVAWTAVGTKSFFGNFKNPLSLVFFFIIGSLPVFWWNYTNDFISFLFQINHGVGAKSWKAEWTLSYVIAQVLLITPLILFYALKANGNDPKNKILKWAAWTPLVFFFLTSFKGRVEANWPIMAHSAVLLLALTYTRASIQWLKMVCVIWAILFLVAYMNFFKSYLPIKKLTEFDRYKNIEKIINDYEPIYGRTFQMSSQLSFRAKKQIYKLHGMNRFDFYDSLEDSKPKSDQFYLISIDEDRLPKIWQEKGYSIQESIKIDEQFNLLKVAR